MNQKVIGIPIVIMIIIIGAYIGITPSENTEIKNVELLTHNY